MLRAKATVLRELGARALGEKSRACREAVLLESAALSDRADAVRAVAREASEAVARRGHCPAAESTDSPPAALSP